MIWEMGRWYALDFPDILREMNTTCILLLGPINQINSACYNAITGAFCVDLSRWFGCLDQ
jgi:hypothetical protein